MLGPTTVVMSLDAMDPASFPVLVDSVRWARQ
jgi:hypothetical protein